MFVNVQSYIDWVYRMTGIKEEAGFRIATNKDLKLEYKAQKEHELKLSMEGPPSNETSTAKPKEEAKTEKPKEVENKKEETNKELKTKKKKTAAPKATTAKATTEMTTTEEKSEETEPPAEAVLADETADGTTESGEGGDLDDEIENVELSNEEEEDQEQRRFQ